MKAAVMFALASAASAMQITGCVVPSTYLQSTPGVNGGATTCTGVQPGYQVYGVCLTGLDRSAYGLTAANEVRTLINAANVNTFSPVGTSLTTGCVVPNFNQAWNIAAGGMGAVTANPLVTGARCQGLPAANMMGTPILNAAVSPFKGIDVRCDRTNGFFPVQGVEGTQVCGAAQGGGGIFPARAAPNANADYFFGGSVFQSFDFAQTNPTQFAGATTFMGANMLLCAQGCVLPASICTNGQLNGNIVGVGSGFNQATCTLAPSRNGLADTSFQFRCAVGGAFGQTFTAGCTSASTTPTLGGFGSQCGVTDGALSSPLFNDEGNLDSWANPRNQLAGEITNYQGVTSVLSIAFAVQNAAYATLHHREWNNNPAQALRNGNVYQIAINGCAAFAGAARLQCVQQTLNYWRCEFDFPFYGGSTCYAGGVVIACPTNELGFRCKSSSKKGLLGLLGLLALIPCLLLCCCLLLLCCIRRKKTEADVHFATFDPHAAPIVGQTAVVNQTACMPTTTCVPGTGMMAPGMCGPTVM